MGKMHFFFHSMFYTTIDPKASVSALRKTYFGLGGDKWKECIDGKYHHLGKDVFKLGTHLDPPGRYKEPGYVPSMEEAFKFCAKSLNKKVDSDWYLQLHQITCAHFDGDPEVYLMGQEKVGVFRSSDDNVMWNLSCIYVPTQEARAELIALDARITRELGPDYGIGQFDQDSTGQCIRLTYKKMSGAHVRKIFDKFLTEFYTEVQAAQTPDAKLTAIARLNKHLELLHPPKDGCGRTNTALINKLLTEYGFHPAILDNPYLSSSWGLNQWTEYMKAGLRKWELECAKLGGCG